MKQIYLLLLVFIFIPPCYGQVNTTLLTDSLSAARQSKIIKPQGTHKDDNIRCGLQDKAGNIWFGTSGGGVYRYDGKSFTNFTEKDGLSNNIVWSILEDKTGNIWFGTNAGICRYDQSAEQSGGKAFTNIPIVVTNSSNLLSFTSPNNAPPVINGVWSMLQDKSGKIWLGTDNNVYCYDGKTFTRFLDNNDVINNSGLHLKRIDCIVEDKNGNMWFASGMQALEGICRYDPVSGTLTNFKPDSDGWIRTILEDKKGNIWFGTRSHGLWRYDGKTYTDFIKLEGAAKFVQFYGNRIYSVPSILEDKAGNIWFSNEIGGVWRYDGRSFKNFTTKDGLINNSVWCILEDRTGNIWVGSRNNGLHRYDPSSEQAGGKAFTSFTE